MKKIVLEGWEIDAVEEALDMARRTRECFEKRIVLEFEDSNIGKTHRVCVDEDTIMITLNK